MRRAELKELSNKELTKKEKSLRILSYVFIPILVGLPFFFIQSFNNGEGLNMPLLVIIISTVGGLLSIMPTLKLLQEELLERGI